MTGTDLLLSDLDGVVYRGSEAVPFAAEALTLAAKSARIGFVTNSAARSTETISGHLRSFGVDAATTDVVTSAHAASWMLPSLIPPGSTVLVVGSDSLRFELERAGYAVTHSALDTPAAVVQGFSADVTWPQLSDAARAVRADPGVVWIATNLDSTVPSPEGLQLENGALVAAVGAAVDRPPLVAGKPEIPIYQAALDRFAAKHALFVGDRLDTDILGAKRAGLKSALVLTGVDGLDSLLAASAGMRPDFILEDLRSLNEPYESAEVVDGGAAAQLGDTRVELVDGAPVVTKRGRPIDEIRASCAVLWNSTTAE